MKMPTASASPTRNTCLAAKLAGSNAAAAGRIPTVSRKATCLVPSKRAPPLIVQSPDKLHYARVLHHDWMSGKQYPRLQTLPFWISPQPHSPKMTPPISCAYEGPFGNPGMGGYLPPSSTCGRSHLRARLGVFPAYPSSHIFRSGVAGLIIIPRANPCPRCPSPASYPSTRTTPAAFTAASASMPALRTVSGISKPIRRAAASTR